MKYAIEPRERDEFGVVQGSGFVIVHARTRKRLDWPMLETEAEAHREVQAFIESDRQLASDEASEAFGFSRMERLP